MNSVKFVSESQMEGFEGRFRKVNVSKVQSSSSLLRMQQRFGKVCSGSYILIFLDGY